MHLEQILKKKNNIFEYINYLKNIKISEPLNKDFCLNLYLKK